jgi:hypothetical protein
MSKYELDHAKTDGVRYFIIHGPLPKGLTADAYGYPICDSMNRHHSISPEEDEANGKLVVAALNIATEIQRIMEVYREQEASSYGVDTPGGLEHMGDVWSLLRKWDKELGGSNG